MRWILITVVCVAGCTPVPDDVTRVPAPVAVAPEADANVALNPPPVAGDVVAPAALVQPDAPDTPTAPVAPSGALGSTVASLGNAAEPGLWLKTPLVSTTRPGKVVSAKTGRTVDVTLIPIDGPATAGSRLSLAAMQAVGASLTDLVEVNVTAS